MTKSLSFLSTTHFLTPAHRSYFFIGQTLRITSIFDCKSRLSCLLYRFGYEMNWRSLYEIKDFHFGEEAFKKS